MESIFKDLRVLELASVLAGPAVGSFFSELGAKVIKVENKLTGGDVTRNWKHKSESKTKSDSAYYYAANWKKENRFLDVTQQEDYEIVVDLIRSSDIIISNFRASSASKLNLDYEKVKKIKSDIIYGEISAYGVKDSRAGFDILVQAETGWISMTGDKEGAYARIPVALMDILTAHQLKEGILCALIHKLKTGKGSKVDVSLFDTGIASLANQAANYLNTKVVPTKMGTMHPNIAPYGDIVYSKDEKALILAIGTENHFRQLCEILDMHLHLDSSFSTNQNRLLNREQLMSEILVSAKKMNFDEIIRRANLKGVPISGILNLREVFALPSTNNLVINQQDNSGNKIKSVKSVVFNINQE